MSLPTLTAVIPPNVVPEANTPTFIPDMDAWLVWANDHFVPELNILTSDIETAVVWMNERVNETKGYADAAHNARVEVNNASASVLALANYHGIWSDSFSGGYSLGASVLKNGMRYISNHNNNTSDPEMDESAWSTLDMLLRFDRWLMQAPIAKAIYENDLLTTVEYFKSDGLMKLGEARFH